MSSGLNWSVTAYVCHVADNLRIFAERMVGVARGGGPRVAAYNQDDLAQARHYIAVAIPGALWPLKRALSDWLTAIEVAQAADVVFEHPERGRYTWADVVSSNLHDAVHHEADIRRTSTRRRGRIASNRQDYDAAIMAALIATTPDHPVCGPAFTTVSGSAGRAVAVGRTEEGPQP